MEDPFYNGLRQVEIDGIPIEMDVGRGQMHEWVQATPREMTLYAEMLISSQIQRGQRSCGAFLVMGRNYRWGME